MPVAGLTLEEIQAPTREIYGDDDLVVLDASLDGDTFVVLGKDGNKLILFRISPDRSVSRLVTPDQVKSAGADDELVEEVEEFVEALGSEFGEGGDDSQPAPDGFGDLYADLLELSTDILANEPGIDAALEQLSDPVPVDARNFTESAIAHLSFADIQDPSGLDAFERAELEFEFGAKISRVAQWRGHQIGIEHEVGSERFGREMKVAYGHFRGLIGEDGEAADAYIGPCFDCPRIWGIEQLDADGGFDETKYMICFASMDAAEKAYKRQMPARFFGGIREVTPEELLSIRRRQDFGLLSQFAENRPGEKPAVTGEVWGDEEYEAQTTVGIGDVNAALDTLEALGGDK